MKISLLRILTIGLFFNNITHMPLQGFVYSSTPRNTFISGLGGSFTGLAIFAASLLICEKYGDIYYKNSELSKKAVLSKEKKGLLLTENSSLKKYGQLKSLVASSKVSPQKNIFQYSHCLNNNFPLQTTQGQKI